ncbi:MAG: hypothetical protein QGH80_06095, partial [Acidimicrobiales bacterium]|nr:hypothetical protein [Acidimicrobiales bacterium]
PTLASYSIKEAVNRAGIDPEEVEDVVMGCAQQQGTQALNIGRLGGSQVWRWWDQRMESACGRDIVGRVSLVGTGISPTGRSDSFDRAAACVDCVEWNWGVCLWPRMVAIT